VNIFQFVVVSPPLLFSFLVSSFGSHGSWRLVMYLLALVWIVIFALGI